MAKFVFPNLENLMALYLFQLRYLLNCCINLYKDFFDEIRFSHRYFDHKMLMYQPAIVKIIIYYRKIDKKLDDKHKVYTNRKYPM